MSIAILESMPQIYLFLHYNSAKHLFRLTRLSSKELTCKGKKHKVVCKKRKVQYLVSKLVALYYCY